MESRLIERAWQTSERMSWSVPVFNGSCNGAMTECAEVRYGAA